MIGQCRSWLLCPVGTSSLEYLIRFNQTSDEYTKVIKQFKDIIGIRFHNRIFVSPKCTKLKSCKNIAIVDFSQQNGHVKISEWLNQCGFKAWDIKDYFSATTQYALMNIAEFQMPWLTLKEADPIMKVYNTFSYTEDIKYEPKLLEIPLKHKYFKLVILLPSEENTTSCLFKKLVSGGISSAVKSIQPLFTAISDLKMPNIKFQEEYKITLEGFNYCKHPGVSNGCVNINNEGVHLKCLTCIHSDSNLHPGNQLHSNAQSRTFLFAIMFKDTAIFTGQYVADNVFV